MTLQGQVVAPGVGDQGATAIAGALQVNADLKLETLFVGSRLKSNPQLVAACREKGVRFS